MLIFYRITFNRIIDITIILEILIYREIIKRFHEFFRFSILQYLKPPPQISANGQQLRYSTFATSLCTNE